MIDEAKFGEPRPSFCAEVSASTIQEQHGRVKNYAVSQADHPNPKSKRVAIMVDVDLGPDK